MDKKKDTCEMREMASKLEELDIDVDLNEACNTEEVNTENLMQAIVKSKKKSKMKDTMHSVIYDLDDIFDGP